MRIKGQLVDGLYQPDKIGQIGTFTFFHNSGLIGAIAYQLVPDMYPGLKAQGHQFAGQVVHFGFRKPIVLQTAMEEQVTQRLILRGYNVGIHHVLFRGVINYYATGSTFLFA
jgi:hypothetical protein